MTQIKVSSRNDRSNFSIHLITVHEWINHYTRRRGARNQSEGAHTHAHLNINVFMWSLDYECADIVWCSQRAILYKLVLKYTYIFDILGVFLMKKRIHLFFYLKYSFIWHFKISLSSLIYLSFVLFRFVNIFKGTTLNGPSWSFAKTTFRFIDVRY